MANRLGRLGLKNDWFSLNHAGGILGRGAIDMAEVLHYKIKAHHGARKLTVVVTMDVKGAFNVVRAKPMRKAL